MVKNGGSKMERSVRRGLERSYNRAKELGNVLNVHKDRDKFIIFSDLHRGMRDNSDDFKRCEKNYRAALDHYYAMGYTLIVLGDIEELWECTPRQVMKAYRDSLLQEVRFAKMKRYFKISGNHDDYWERAYGVKKHLGPIFKRTIDVKENLILKFYQGRGPPKEAFLVHGHQGDPVSDRSRTVAKFLVRYLWRPIQRLTNIKSTTPATNFELRGEHDIAMFRWAKRKKGLMLVAGHTHHPIFESMDHLGRVDHELKKLAAGKGGKKGKGSKDELNRKRKALVKKGHRPFSMERPCYFNTGCCSFSDGDITGIEIAEGAIRLVRWPDDKGRKKAKVLQEADLGEVLNAL